MTRLARALSGASLIAFACSTAASAEGKWCEGVNLTVFSGGPAGGAFNIVIDSGVNQAAADTGANVSLIYSDWDFDKMITQLRDTIGQAPMGIAMMGHPGDAALMPLAEQAAAAGIPIMYVNVDVPEVRAKFGSGYVGADLYAFGKGLGEEALRRAGDMIKPGDKAIVMSRWESENRAMRELGAADALTAAGIEVIKLQEAEGASSDTMLQLPSLTATLLSNPEVKMIIYPGAQYLSVVPAYMQAVGKQPGDIFNAGFDLGAGVMTAIEQGYVQLTGDQQPFLQGYLPVISLCQQVKYKLGPLVVNTGSGFVGADNFKDVIPLSEAAIR